MSGQPVMPRLTVLVAFVSVAMLATTLTSIAQTAPAAISLDPRWAQIGSTVTVDGTGFDPGCSVELLYDDAVIATITPTASGTFSHPFSVPDGLVGDHLVVADQQVFDCNPLARDTLETFRFEVSPNSGPAGSTATASGEGFPDVEECDEVVISFDGVEVARASTTGFPGDPFAVDFVVPDRPPGSYVVEALQTTCGTRRGTDTFRIPVPPTEPPSEPPTEPPTEPPSEPPSEPPTEPPALTIDPGQGPVETPATTDGTGFYDGVEVEIRFGDIPVATVPGLAVDAEGRFTEPIVVPTGVPGGPTVVTACQRCGESDERSATTVFVVTPRLFLDPGIGPPGFVAQATGDGFPATATVTLTWQPGIGRTITTTDAAGMLRTGVLVFHRDRLGPRELQVLVADEVEPLVAPFLVVPGSGQPGTFSFRR